jgi:hypothetical protein
LELQLPGGPIAKWAVTLLGMRTKPGEIHPFASGGL